MQPGQAVQQLRFLELLGTDLDDDRVPAKDMYELYEAWCRADIVGLHFHDLRGTFVLHKYTEGWSIEDISKVTGHQSVDSVLESA